MLNIAPCIRLTYFQIKRKFNCEDDALAGTGDSSACRRGAWQQTPARGAQETLPAAVPTRAPCNVEVSSFLSRISSTGGKTPSSSVLGTTVEPAEGTGAGRQPGSQLRPLCGSGTQRGALCLLPDEPSSRDGLRFAMVPTHFTSPPTTGAAVQLPESSHWQP